MTFDPDVYIQKAVTDGDRIAGATIALESYGLELYRFIAQQVEPDEIDDVFARVADVILCGLPTLTNARVRDWIFTLVHDAAIRARAGDPRSCGDLVFERWVCKLSEGFRRVAGVGRDGLPRQLHALALRPLTYFGRPPRSGFDRIAMQRIR